jgi:PAS domain S-box-containing protein
LRASKQSNDELGQLVDGFNEMLTQIQARDAALQTARDSLESRVRERTAELAAANQSLVAEIAERKRAEESLRLLGSAVEQAEDSIYITDAQFDQPDSILLFVNPAFTKMTGYTAQEVQGKTPRILYGERTDTAILARLRAALSRGEAFHGELINYRKDGSEFQAEMHVAPIRDAKGAITHFVSIKRDVTERRRFEERLFQSQKMETVGKLAGGVAHEFNSIMTAILGHSELLLFDLPEGNPLRKSASEIHHAADRAAILTRQLLAYGRKQMLQADVLDLNTVLAGMENTLRHIAGRDVDVHIAPSAGPKLVKADPGQIEQVIVNIVMNAADAMPHGGKLTLETAETFLDQQYVSRFADLKPGEYVMVAITDTGAGMSEAVKARLFEPFFTTKEVGKGTGLGLATCHGIIKQSDGHINVYSEPGRGATFKIYLPKVRLEVKPAGPPLKSPGMPRGTETILLVEDDPALRQMAATLLERLGYTLLTAGNGLEALNVTHQQTTGRIDLLFTDVVMPHMSGKELADRVRSLYPQTKILFTSAYTENAFSHQGVLQPGIALLQKPFTPSALAAKVREVLDSEKAAAARQ